MSESNHSVRDDVKMRRHILKLTSWLFRVWGMQVAAAKAAPDINQAQFGGAAGTGPCAAVVSS
jgi:hypothetical protein